MPPLHANKTSLAHPGLALDARAIVAAFEDRLDALLLRFGTGAVCDRCDAERELRELRGEVNALRRILMASDGATA
jgi:hypothetical protein